MPSFLINLLASSGGHPRQRGRALAASSRGELGRSGSSRRCAAYGRSVALVAGLVSLTAFDQMSLFSLLGVLCRVDRRSFEALSS
jgi:hypothetical protein